MSSQESTQRLRLTLTEAQKAAVVRVLGREADAIELQVE